MTTHQKARTQNRQVKSYPAPSQLATVTDLTQQEVQAITEALNPLVADFFTLYVKTKNFHWHLAGSHFRDYHLLFDEQADQIFDSIDILPQRVRPFGGTTLRSITPLTEFHPIEDCHQEFLP